MFWQSCELSNFSYFISNLDPSLTLYSLILLFDLIKSLMCSNTRTKELLKDQLDAFQLLIIISWHFAIVLHLMPQ